MERAGTRPLRKEEDNLNTCTASAYIVCVYCVYVKNYHINAHTVPLNSSAFTFLLSVSMEIPDTTGSARGQQKKDNSAINICDFICPSAVSWFSSYKQYF